MKRISCIFLISLLLTFNFVEASTIVINEIMSSNTSVLEDRDNDYPDWIELYNFGDFPVNLIGYGLSDQDDNPFRWIFPDVTIEPGGFMIVFASGKDRVDNSEIHTNFKIKSSGEPLLLSSPEGEIFDRVPALEIPSDVSLGREPDNLENWLYYQAPTPLLSNTTQGYSASAGTVIMSIDGGFFEFEIMVALSCDTAGVSIHYTLDGYDPDETSLLYETPFTVSSTTVVKAIALFEGSLPGPISVNSYFIGIEHTLPVISLSSQNIETIYNTIVEEHPRHTISNDAIIPNWPEAPEAPVNIEFFEPDGSRGFSIVVGFRLHGMSRRYGTDPKSFSIMARNRYGYDTIDYRIFPDLPVTYFSSLVLRNSKINSIFRDPLASTLIKDIEIDSQAYRPAVLYLNGVYWGLVEIREKLNTNYLANHHDVDPDNVDMMETDGDFGNKYPVILEGDNDHYNALTDFAQNNDLSIEENYSYVDTQMDIGNYMRNFVCEIYFENRDWTFQNIKWWRPKTQDGRWRWILYDIDFGFWTDVGYGYSDRGYDFLQMVTAPLSGSYYIPPWTTLLLRRLLLNDQFRYCFINLFADYNASIFNTERVLATIDQIQSKIESEMPAHLEHWAEQMVEKPAVEKKFSPFHDITSMEIWYEDIEVLKECVTNRQDILRSSIINKFNLSGAANISLNVDPPESGTIKLNTLSISDFPWMNPYFMDVPIPLAAVPEIGYKFIRWEGIDSESESNEIILNDDLSITAVFEKMGDNIIVEQFQSPYELSEDLVIEDGMKLTLEAGVEIVMSKDVNIIVNGELHLNGTSENPVVIRPADGVPHWGAICFDNASGASSFSHAYIIGASTGKDAINFPAAISGYKSDIIVDNVRFEENIQSIFVYDGSVTIRSCLFTETNRSEHINIMEAVALVENCRIMDVLDRDGIDFDGVTNGIIQKNKIISSGDDGIDIGNGCSNVLIADNRIFNCADKGISIGENSRDIMIERNIIGGSYFGIAVKDSSNAFIDHTTLYDNEIAVAAYEKGEDAYGGGTAFITNSILAGSHTAAIQVDPLSLITVAYSLVDTELLPGKGNIQTNPLFVSAENRIFTLQASSPAINAGDPLSPFDSDGSRTDMGALEYRLPTASIVITEINYNSEPDFDTEDWVELYNTSESDTDLSGWEFKDEDDTHVFTILEGVVLGAGYYLVLCRDVTKFSTFFPDVKNMIGDFDFGLNNGGEVIRLFNSVGYIIDFVDFSDTNPWPEEPDGNGPTLSLISPSLDNSLSVNWEFSTGHGTPGSDNSMSSVGAENPLEFSLSQNYPNPFNSVTTISFSIPESAHMTLTIYSVLGQRITSLMDDRLSAGSHTVQFDASDLSSGIYFYRIEAGEYIKTASMMLVK